MSKELKVIKKSYRNDDTFHANHLNLQISGSEINHVIINTLRRIIKINIPCFAFDPEKMTITKNDSVFNNDILRKNLQLFPVYNVENKLDFVEYDKLRKYGRGKKSYTEETIDDDDSENLDNISVLNAYLKIKNEDDEILAVTTNHFEFYNKGKKISSIYSTKNPLIVCELKKGEELEISAIVSKGIPLNHERFACASQCSFERESENSYLFKLEAISQFSEKEIYIRATKIILYILDKLKERLVNTKYEKNNHGKITLDDFDHTVGNLLSYEIQKHPNIKLCGYKVDHLLIRRVTIEYITDGKKTINQIIETSINNLTKLFGKLLSKFESIKL